MRGDVGGAQVGGLGVWRQVKGEPMESQVVGSER